MAWNIHYHSKREKGWHSGEIVTSKTETWQIQPKSLDGCFFASPNPWSFGDLNTTLWAGSILCCSQQLSYGSGISNILGSPTKSSFTNSASHNGLFGPPYKDSYAKPLPFPAFLTRQEDLKPFTPASFMTLNPEPLGCLIGLGNLAHSLNYTCISFGLLMLSFIE